MSNRLSGENRADHACTAAHAIVWYVCIGTVFEMRIASEPELAPDRGGWLVSLCTRDRTNFTCAYIILTFFRAMCCFFFFFLVYPFLFFSFVVSSDALSSPRNPPPPPSPALSGRRTARARILWIIPDTRRWAEFYFYFYFSHFFIADWGRFFVRLVILFDRKFFCTIRN